MTNGKWALGKIYRDKASSRNPDDQFLGWFRTSDDRSIGNASGIRSLRFSPEVESKHPHACIVLVTSELRNDRSLKWIDPLPDYATGAAFYWGDAQAGKDKAVNEWNGNRVLLESGYDSDDHVPTLVFSKPKSGAVRFLGLAYIDSIEEKTQRQLGGTPVRNLEASLVILDCKEVDPEWIKERAVNGPSVDPDLAPEAWLSVKSEMLKKIKLTESEAESLGLPVYPKTAVDAFHFITPEDIVAAIQRYDGGDRADFFDSREYDLIFDGLRYPPKAIAGMACNRILGRDATPSEFSGGKGSPAFRMFSRLGFDWVTKEQAAASDEESVALANGILLTWNKARWNWTDLADRISTIRAGRQAAEDETVGKNRWSVGNRKSIPAGTRFFLIKLGQQPKGIIGCGKTASKVYQDTHFDPAKAAEGKQANYVQLIWEELVDPFTEGVLDVSKFEESELTSIHWSTQQSGINIPSKSLTALEEKWSEFLKSIDRIPTGEAAKPADPYSLEKATDGLFMDPEDFGSIVSSLQRRKNVILQGPPGVGKSFIAKRIAYALLGEKDPDRVEMVQFHQSYAYEDFIQGYRPAKKGFKRANGVFYRFSRKAGSDTTDRPYVFIIDEINRGNLAAILGEVMLLIESDKRGPDHAIPLTYSSEQDALNNPDSYRFYVPENLYILGLMNTADRSLALVDYALRRRFRFFALWPQFNDRFREYLKSRGCGSSMIAKISDRISEINKQISDDHQNLGPGYQIGHSYFCPDGDEPTEDWYRSVVKESIEPLLDEYFGVDDPARVEEITDWLLN